MDIPEILARLHSDEPQVGRLINKHRMRSQHLQTEDEPLEQLLWKIIPYSIKVMFLDFHLPLQIP